MGGVHEDCNDELEQALDVVGGVVFCDFDQIDVFCADLFAGLSYVGLDLLDYFL